MKNYSRSTQIQTKNTNPTSPFHSAAGNAKKKNLLACVC